MYEKGYAPGPNQQKLIKATKKQIRSFFPEKEQEKINFSHISFIIMNALRGFTMAFLNRRQSINAEEKEELIEQFINIMYQGLLGFTQ